MGQDKLLFLRLRQGSTCVAASSILLLALTLSRVRSSLQFLVNGKDDKRTPNASQEMPLNASKPTPHTQDTKKVVISSFFMLLGLRASGVAIFTTYILTNPNLRFCGASQAKLNSRRRRAGGDFSYSYSLQLQRWMQPIAITVNITPQRKLM